MSARRYELVLCRDINRELTLDAVASCAGIHPELVERFIEWSLIEPAGWAGANPVFDVSVVSRIRVIERLRGDLGINLAGIAVILEMTERLRALESENEQLRGL